MSGGLPGGLDAALLARWDEPHRHYHDRRHLAQLLDVVDRHPHLGADLTAVRYAAWFHDAVYDPRSAGNEEASAELAITLLTGHCHPDLVAEVARLVRLTTTHDPAPDDLNGALLCDADLTILAADPDAYAAYAAAVRREYAHVPDDAFRAGRAAVLRRLLDRPVLFHVVDGRANLTRTARGNLVTELATLGA